MFILGAYNNAGLVPLANVIAPGVPPPSPYTPNPVGTGKVMIFGALKVTKLVIHKHTLGRDSCLAWHVVTMGAQAQEPY